MKKLALVLLGVILCFQNFHAFAETVRTVDVYEDPHSPSHTVASPFNSIGHTSYTTVPFPLGQFYWGFSSGGGSCSLDVQEQPSYSNNILYYGKYTVTAHYDNEVESNEKCEVVLYNSIWDTKIVPDTTVIYNVIDAATPLQVTSNYSNITLSEDPYTPQQIQTVSLTVPFKGNTPDKDDVALYADVSSTQCSSRIFSQSPATYTDTSTTFHFTLEPKAYLDDLTEGDHTCDLQYTYWLHVGSESMRYTEKVSIPIQDYRPGLVIEKPNQLYEKVTSPGQSTTGSINLHLTKQPSDREPVKVSMHTTTPQVCSATNAEFIFYQDNWNQNQSFTITAVPNSTLDLKRDCILQFDIVSAKEQGGATYMNNMYTRAILSNFSYTNNTKSKIIKTAIEYNNTQVFSTIPVLDSGAPLPTPTPEPTVTPSPIITPTLPPQEATPPPQPSSSSSSSISVPKLVQTGIDTLVTIPVLIALMVLSLVAATITYRSIKR